MKDVIAIVVVTSLTLLAWAYVSDWLEHCRVCAVGAVGW